MNLKNKIKKLLYESIKVIKEDLISEEELKEASESVPTNKKKYANAKAYCKKRYDVIPCVPIDTTKALTKEGFKSYQELRIGDEILAYDMKTKTNKWTPILNLHFYKNTKTIKMEKPGHKLELISTPDHKWVTYNTYGGDTQKIVINDAEHVYELIQELKESKITFAKAKEERSNIQHLYNYYKNNTYEEFLDKSKFTVGGEKLLTTTELMKENSHIRLKIAAPLDLQYNEYELNNENYSKYGQNWGNIVLNMSRNQAKTFFSSGIIYDGSQVRDNYLNEFRGEVGNSFSFKQKHRDHMDALVHSTILSGRYIYYNQREDCINSAYISDRNYIPVRTFNFDDYLNLDVWCPETEFGTWVMKQNNNVLITGNSAYYSSCIVKRYKYTGGGYRKKKK